MTELQQLAQDARDCLDQASRIMSAPVLTQKSIEAALNFSTVATAKLNSLKLLMVGVGPPKVG